VDQTGGVRGVKATGHAHEHRDRIVGGQRRVAADQFVEGDGIDRRRDEVHAAMGAPEVEDFDDRGMIDRRAQLGPAHELADGFGRLAVERFADPQRHRSRDTRRDAALGGLKAAG
jgi:hypothetical protein